VLLKGEKIAIFAYGSRVDSALKAGKVLGGSAIDMRFVKPLDEQLIVLLVRIVDTTLFESLVQ
jgi:1-deoxy-D-xylulose-5-phosphate synthase